MGAKRKSLRETVRGAIGKLSQTSLTDRQRLLEQAGLHAERDRVLGRIAGAAAQIG